MASSASTVEWGPRFASSTGRPSRRIARLLISIATESEVVAAIEGGAEILDVKDPGRGSLGLADPRVVRAACTAGVPRAAGRLVSAALGDRLAGSEAAALPDSAAELVREGAQVLKVGLAGSGTRGAAAALGGLRRRLDELVGGLSHDLRLVAVAFADGAPGEGVTAHQLPDVALAAGADGAMLDTLRKGRSLLDVMGEKALGRWVEQVRMRGLISGLAGSLGLADLPRAVSLGADVIGLRGAVCAGGRTGNVVAARVRMARQALDRAAAAAGDQADLAEQRFSLVGPASGRWS